MKKLVYLVFLIGILCCFTGCNDKNKEASDGNSDGRQMNGEKHSVILFHDVMSEINDCSGENENDYSIPSDVKKIRICRKTGLAASEACENTMDGYFMSDDVVEECGCR